MAVLKDVSMLDTKTAVAKHLLSLHFFPGLIHFYSLLFPSFLFTLSHPDFFGWLLSFLIFLIFQMAGFFFILYFFEIEDSFPRRNTSKHRSSTLTLMVSVLSLQRGVQQNERLCGQCDEVL